jgi:hypothetical protein
MSALTQAKAAALSMAALSQFKLEFQIQAKFNIQTKFDASQKILYLEAPYKYVTNLTNLRSLQQTYTQTYCFPHTQLPKNPSHM